MKQIFSDIHPKYFHFLDIEEYLWMLRLMISWSGSDKLKPGRGGVGQSEVLVVSKGSCHQGVETEKILHVTKTAFAVKT